MGGYSTLVVPPVVTPTAVPADLLTARDATGLALALVVGVVPFGFVAVLVASFTSWNFSMNYMKRTYFYCNS